MDNNTDTMDSLDLAALVNIKPPQNGHEYPLQIKYLALSMRASGYSQLETSKQLNISRSAIRSWERNPKLIAGFRETGVLQKIKDNTAYNLYKEANTTLESISDEDREKASYLQKVTGAGILYDKAWKLEGNEVQSTATIINYVSNQQSQQSKKQQEIHELEQVLQDIEYIPPNKQTNNIES